MELANGAHELLAQRKPENVEMRNQSCAGVGASLRTRRKLALGELSLSHRCHIHASAAVGRDFRPKSVALWTERCYPGGAIPTLETRLVALSISILQLRVVCANSTR